MSETAPVTSFAGRLRVQLSMLEQSVDGIGNIDNSPFNTATDADYSITDGTGNLQAKKHHVARVVLTPASGTFDLDLSTMLDKFGNTINPSKVRLLWVFNRSDSGGGNLLVGAASSNPWTAPWASSGAPTTVKQTVEPDGIFMHWAPRTGLAVSGSSKVLRFTHGGGSSGSIPFDIYLLCI